MNSVKKFNNTYTTIGPKFSRMSFDGKVPVLSRPESGSFRPTFRTPPCVPENKNMEILDLDSGDSLFYKSSRKIRYDKIFPWCVVSMFLASLIVFITLFFCLGDRNLTTLGLFGICSLVFVLLGFNYVSSLVVECMLLGISFLSFLLLFFRLSEILVRLYDLQDSVYMLH